MLPSVDDIRRSAAVPMARRGVVRAGLFGSFARGDATADSDVLLDEILLAVDLLRQVLDGVGAGM